VKGVRPVVNDLTLRYRSFLLAFLLASLAGCQTFNGMVTKVTNRNQANYTPPTMPSDEPAPPLTAKQKADVQMAIARSMENQGDAAQAIKNYLEVVKKDPSRADAYQRLAILHDVKGDSQSARKFYLLAAKKDPKSADIQCDFGYSCYLQRSWSEGESHLRRAIALNADCARAHTNLGLLLARTDHEQQALVEFRKAGCNEAAARANLGFAFTLEERWEKARRQFELALAADPNSKIAKRGLAALPPQVATRQVAQGVSNGPMRNPGNSSQQGQVREPRTGGSTIQASYEAAPLLENLVGGANGR
jgi:Tfp pilus assembly protein PilF